MYKISSLLTAKQGYGFSTVRRLCRRVIYWGKHVWNDQSGEEESEDSMQEENNRHGNH